ncbi:MAG: alpha/beta fold hydrolase [Vicinamibacterales bacterium]|nr:alpha/beta fold hydrolase [Vicinamibacterales bacterium]
MPVIPVNGVNLYYEWHGPASAPVLVLNNGILMNAAVSWRPQTAAFSATYRVLQYDCRCQGLSDHPDSPCSMELHADDLAALLGALQVDRAHILGISYGGEVAQAFALNYPAQVRSLILADTVSEIGPELRLIVEGWKAAALAGDADLVFLVTVPWNFSPRFIATQREILAAARVRYRDLDLPALVRLADAFAGVNFTERLPEITCPTCVLVGDEDLIKGPRYAHVIQRAIAGSELHVIAGAGHATCWEDPARFNQIVLEFLHRQATA